MVLLLLLALNLEPSGPGLVLTAVMAGAALMIFVAALTWHLAVRLARAQFGELLRESRQQAQSLTQLQPDWLWQTDAQHHLIRWQAPQGAPASSWAGTAMNGAVTQRLWERFQPLSDANGASTEAPVPDLRGQVEPGQSFDRLRVVDGQGRRWELRGQATTDAAGRFAGHLGAARVLDDTPTADSDMVLSGPTAGTAATSSTEWLQALPGPAWLLSDNAGAGNSAGGAAAGGTGAATRLIDFNDAAAQMMGGSEARGQLWRACEERLPEELRQALAQPDLQSGSACGAWWLCLTALPHGGARLLSLWPQGAVETVPAALAMQAAEQARADQASFSYTVSHDLRAPLRVVEGFTRILKEDYGRLLDRAGNDHLDRVLGASTRMHSMIDSLLALSHLSSQALRHETVDLSLLASQVVDELRRGAPTRAVDAQVQSGLRVQGDPTLLRMVLENLLGNAWKYSGKRDHAEIRFESEQRQGERVFVVTDNGAGFDMRFADRLFGVFQRLHSASDFQGTGVGLASARRIVRRHGGDIWAESEVGQGARFYFTLPN
ncbi:sensor histidine kinase [Roseateles chitinivorans]|uniref:sensor histidine kinase n=1 Tax=Roseateles chitinivorans TaxID=2917965 RepID=UPI003D668DA0